MARTISIISITALLICQVASQSTGYQCSAPSNGAKLPSEMDPLGCSRPGGLRFPLVDLTNDCTTFVNDAYLPRYFDPWGCTRAGGVQDWNDPSYTPCNTYPAGSRIPNGMPRLRPTLTNWCSNLSYERETGRLLWWYGTNQYYALNDNRLNTYSAQTGFYQSRPQYIQGQTQGQTAQEVQGLNAGTYGGTGGSQLGSSGNGASTGLGVNGASYGTSSDVLSGSADSINGRLSSGGTSGGSSSSVSPSSGGSGGSYTREPSGTTTYVITVPNSNNNLV